MGRELAPLIAARLQTGLTVHCVDLVLDENHLLEQRVQTLEFVRNEPEGVPLESAPTVVAGGAGLDPSMAGMKSKN
jgi:electron transfer flavoprotein alpha subunit